jgi:septal ring factor EnvC (AmiA/AmiB activator)
MATGSESNQEARDQGFRDGRVETRLDAHDKRLEKINGSIEKGATETHGLRLDLQRMEGDLKAQLDTVIATARAAAATVVATAEALRLADEARRTTDRDATTKSDRSWTPVQRFLAVMGAIVVTVGTAVAIYANLHR